MSAQLALLPAYLTAHLQLTLVALLLGIAASVPAGILVTRVRWLEQPVLAIASLVQTIPGLALLAVMVPALAALGLPSIGYLPAIAGLTLYSVLPILRNTATGLAGVDAALVEAARGVGMTPAQQLWRVELPTALPVIVAGIRTAAVWTVGMATLATPVGATSLGNYIFTGLQTRNFTAVLVGCAAASALALLLDGLVRLLERGLHERRRPVVAIALAAFAVLCLYAAAAALPAFHGNGGQPVRIGAKTFTEQYVISEMLARVVRDRTGLPTEVVQSLGSTVAFDALRTGALDVYVDYSGTIWATIMKRHSLPENRADVLPEVARYLRETDGITLVGPLGFENAYALALRDTEAERLGVRRIGDLAPAASRMTIGGDYEFFARPEWREIEKVYGLSFATQRSMDSSLMYQALAAGEVDVISAFSTDGRIAAFHLRVLEDDRGAIPPYDAVLLASPDVVRDRPQVIEALRSLVGRIDAEEMRRMNLAVDQDGKTPAAVADEFVGRLRGADH